MNGSVKGLDALQAELAILQWRDEQLEAIYRQLHDEMEPLRSHIHALVNKVPVEKRDLVLPLKRKRVISELTKDVNRELTHWAELQGRRAAERARREFGQVTVPIERFAGWVPAAKDALERFLTEAVGNGVAPVPASAVAGTLKGWRKGRDNWIASHLEGAIFCVGAPPGQPAKGGWLRFGRRARGEIQGKVQGGIRGQGGVEGEVSPCLLQSLQTAILKVAEYANRAIAEAPR